MPPVDDVDVSPLMRKTRHEAGCHGLPPASHGYWAPNRIYRPDGSFVVSEKYIQHTMTMICLQLGKRIGMDWVELDECLECESERDWDYITRSRRMIECG